MQLRGKRRQVVVKVRHPGVSQSITIDFRLLKPVAAAASRIPSLKGLSLKESLAQFSANMTAQVQPRLPRYISPCSLLKHGASQSIVLLLQSIGPSAPQGYRPVLHDSNANI